MLETQSWLPQAEALEIGRSRRIRHDCGEGTPLKVARSEDGWSAWCFRCNDKGWVPIPAPSLEERLARLARLRVQDARLGYGEHGELVDLPVPRVRDVSRWPKGAALWLYRAGISNAEIGRLGIFYHEPSDRVVLPSGTFYQARAYQPGRLPKYIGPTPRPRDLIVRYGTDTSPTLTEDMLSAMKIGSVSEGWAVLGTSVSDHMIAALLKRGAPVNVWLDPDKAGRKGAARYCKQLRAYGLQVRDVLSPRDPKLMHRSEIKEILNGT